jgi:TrmH family RNA methyltransferase
VSARRIESSSEGEGSAHPVAGAVSAAAGPAVRTLSSPRNPLVQRARKLQRRGLRDRDRTFLVEGVTGLEEALAAGAPLDTVFVEQPASPRVAQVAERAAQAGLPVVEVGERAMASISDAATPQGIAAISGFVDRPAAELLDPAPDLSVVLADVRDPGNVGTILRSAWAVAADAVFLGVGTADVYNPKVVRATAGALFRVPVARGVPIPWLLDELGRRGVRRVAADPHSGTAYDDVDLSGRCALVFGNEAWGVPEDAVDRVDERATIPMRGRAESLNVAAAAAVFLFEAARQRRRRGATS